MATVGSAIAALQQPLLPLPLPSAALAPQVNATQASGTTQNADSVTLTGRTAESQQTRTQNGEAQFGETAAYFFAERQTFRAANGSAETTGSAQGPTVPQLPVKISEEGQAASQAQPTPPQPATRQPAAASTTAATTQNQVASTASGASSSQNSGAAATATSGSTPLAELTELDNTLQELGIDPQSISLFNRMAILLYANDPAALRMLAKTLQDGPTAAGNRISPNGATSPPNTNASAGQSQQPAGQTQSGAEGTQIAVPPPPQQPNQNTASTAGATNQNTAAAQSSPAPSNPPADQNQFAPPAPQATSYSSRFADVQAAFAAVGQSQVSSYGQSQASGQLLNVTA